MLLTISGKHIEITDAIRSHIEDKTSKLPKYYNSINQMEVILEGNQAGRVAVEMIARAEHSKVFIAKDSGVDMYSCVDLVTHKIERQLSRQKEKERNNKHYHESSVPLSEPEMTE